LSGLLLLLLAVVFGVTSVTGAGLGGLALMLLPVLQSQYKSLGGLEFLIIGIGAISLGRDPNGIANHLFSWGRAILNRLPGLSTAPVRPGYEEDYDAEYDSGYGYGTSYEGAHVHEMNYDDQVARHGLA
jgi:branched-chain amino acid transport system permease protein